MRRLEYGVEHVRNEEGRLERVLQVRLDDETHRRLMALCGEETLSECVRDILTQHLDAVLVPASDGFAWGDQGCARKRAGL